ncbi:MAG: hypothetical protein ACOYXC_11510 [Candidatus Rifleibacteriota bacterium]
MTGKNIFLLVALFAFLIVAGVAKTGPGIFLDVTVPLLLLSAFFLSSVADSPLQILKAMGNAVNMPDRPASLSDYLILQRLETTMLICGGAVSLGANIASLAFTSTPALVGPCLSIALIGALTAVIGSRLVVYPLRLRIKMNISDFPARHEDGFFPVLAITAFPFACYFSLIMILYAF